MSRLWTTFNLMAALKEGKMTPKGYNPSGRPIRLVSVKKYSSPLPLNDGPLSPGLRKEVTDLDCVGFLHDFQECERNDTID